MCAHIRENMIAASMDEASRHSGESGKRAMLDVGGSKLAYEATGNGTPVLFIHAG